MVRKSPQNPPTDRDDASRDAAPDAPRRVLIVRPSALGDVCRTVPVLASLRKAWPDAHIAWVVQDDFVPAIEGHPALNEIIPFPRNRFGKWWKSPSRAVEVRRWFADLRRRRFDVAIDCQGLSRSGLIVRASRAPLRIGLRSAREFAWLCYNRRVPEGESPLPMHTVERMLTLLEPLGVPAVRDMRLNAPPAAVTWWDEQRRTLGMNDREPYAVLAPGSRWISKRWPIDRFADMIEPLLKRGFARVILIGSNAEREQVKPLLDRFGLDASAARPQAADDQPRIQEHPIIDFVGRTNIGQTMAVIAGAGMVVANDSAPLHMAVGFDRPCIALFGPTDPAAVGPYARAECVVRAYQPRNEADVHFKDDKLGDSLMRLISTAAALQAVDRVLALWPRRERGMDDQRNPPIVETRSSTSRAAVDGVHVHRGLEPEAAS